MNKWCQEEAGSNQTSEESTRIMRGDSGIFQLAGKSRHTRDRSPNGETTNHHLLPENQLLSFHCSSSPPSGLCYQDDSLDTSSSYYCSTATDQGPPGVKPRYAVASFCSSAPGPPGIILQHLQPSRRGDSSPTTEVLTAMIRGGPLLRLRSEINSLLNG
ncbi:hypothetical protein Q5P01_022571 [Channa striata]|uniref:Uncharacterized protein n=1 Tax=Channa striata TaxID=64152 RepID=A0AA88LR40_CHASR|nr:hypothetical protein Q5P01_022571 [Channa striata]